MHSIKGTYREKILFTSPTASTLEEAVLEAARSGASVGIVRGGAFAEVATLNLRGAQLQGADLAYANFGPLDVVDANLSGARLCGLVLSQIGNADLSDADLSAATIGRSGSSSGGVYGGIPLPHLEDPESLRAVDLRGANVAGAKVNAAYFIWLNFTACRNLDRLKVVGTVPIDRGWSTTLFSGLEQRNWNALFSAGWSADGSQYEKPKGGCYVATAVYGSYDCPPVWVLRRYRDETLAHNALGRAFISVYYAVSPWLVRRLGGSGLPARPIRLLLDRIVAGLEQRGFSSKPYLDL